MKSVNLASNSSKNNKDGSNSFCLFLLLCKQSCISSLITKVGQKPQNNETVVSKLLLHKHLVISHILEDKFNYSYFFKESFQ